MRCEGRQRALVFGSSSAGLLVRLCESRSMPTKPDPSVHPGSEPTASSSTLSKIRYDLSRGRNFDLYIVVMVAIAVAVLGIFGVVDARILAASTLAVLGIMATSGLASRHQVEDVKAALERLAATESGNIPAERFLSARQPALDSDVATATEIDLVGVTLTRTIRDMLPVLDRRLRAGARVRVLLVDIDSEANVEAVSRSRKADAPDFYRSRISSTVDLLRVLASSSPGEESLQLRLLPFVPTFGMCAADGKDAHGRIYVEMYQHRTLEPNPSFNLRADRDGRWYALFAGQFETMWESARPLSLHGDRTASKLGSA